MAIEGKKLSELTDKVSEIQGTERIYVSDGSDVPKYINTNQLATSKQLGNKADNVTTENISDTTTEIQPNKYYIFGEVETLTLTLAAVGENKLAEYMFEFTSGTTPTTITEIAGVEWKGDTIEANKVYQASISRGIGILIGRAKA